MSKLLKYLTEGIGFFSLENIKEQPIYFSISAVVFVGLIMLFVLLFKKQKRVEGYGKPTNTKMLVLGAMCIAMAYILSFIKLVELPQAGSLTLASGLPIIIFAYLYGPKLGFVAAFGYSLLQLTQGIWAVGIVQFLLDYPLAFTALGLAALFRKNLIVGIVVGYMGRFICHVVSGALFYAEYAAEYKLDPVSYAAAYNGIVLIPEMILCIIIVLIPQVKIMITNLRKSY